RKGFFDTAVPHCAERTVLSFHVTVTTWMNHAGIGCPCASLRCPLSISWLISTLTSVESPTSVARIFIGSGISASAAAEGDFDLLGGDVVFSVGAHQGVDVRGLRHLDAC